MVIVCGWCGKATANEDRCTSCGHVDPTRPWTQRGDATPVVRPEVAGRPALDPRAIRRRLDEAREAVGPNATAAALAEHLDISMRQLGRWQKVAR